MSRLLWSKDEQWSKIEPLLPHYGSPPRVDDRRILSAIIHVRRCGSAGATARLNAFLHDSLQPLQSLVPEGHPAEYLCSLDQ